MIKIGDRIPEVVMPVRIPAEDNSDAEWKYLTTTEQFAGKRVLLFALPGAFTPTCSSFQLPGFNDNASQFAEKGIDEIYCLSVNDSFVMNSWFDSLGITNCFPLPDGNGEFTEGCGMSVQKGNLGFGIRSWRYAMVINDNIVEHLFAEEGFGDNIETDPYEVSTPENVLNNL